MRVDERELRVLIFYWIKSDLQLRAILRDIQVKLIIERIVKGFSLAKMAKQYQSSPKQIHLLLEAIFLIIEKKSNKQLANLLREINKHDSLKASKSQKRRIRFNTIFLN